MRKADRQPQTVIDHALTCLYARSMPIELTPGNLTSWKSDSTQPVENKFQSPQNQISSTAPVNTNLRILADPN